MTHDRRRSNRDRRLALRVPAVFAVKTSWRGRVELGQAEDVGPGGMTLRRLPDQAIGIGGGVVLTFALPGAGNLLRATGIVVSDGLAGTFRRTGVRFVSLSSEVERRIVAHCERELGASESLLAEASSA